jgi:uncharacterized protein (DUF362 family)
MKTNKTDEFATREYSRRGFLKAIGTASAGLLIAPYLKSASTFAHGLGGNLSYLAQVAVTQATTYDRALIKQKVQHLFESLGGIADIVKTGDKVAIKINLTGGGGDADHMWTNPEVLRAAGELIIDSGVKANDLYIVEALWSTSSYNNYGYADVQKALGAQMVNLNSAAPYATFIDKAVGDKSSNFSSFKMNQILNDINVYVSIPKMKQHYEAGVTCSLKNQIGTVPIQYYTIPTDQGRRGALHNSTGGPSNSFLPHSICDLNLARPVHLALIDGVKNARGGEGTWNPTFQTWEDHVLLAGKDPVATDSIAAHLMGIDPEAAQIKLPDPPGEDRGYCDNYLELLHQKGIGTNQMSEIEIVGDGASLVSVQPRDVPSIPNDFALYQNYPNPFNPSTTFKFLIPAAEHVTIRIYSITGREIVTLVDGLVSQGVHELRWTPNGIASGVYFCEMRAGGFIEGRKMIYQK